MGDAERKEKEKDEKRRCAWRGSLPKATEPGASEGQEAREGKEPLGTRPRREQGANRSKETGDDQTKRKRLQNQIKRANRANRSKED